VRATQQAHQADPRVRVAGFLVAALAIVFAASANAPPLRVECPTERMSVDVCRASVDATLRRGLTAPHPLILAARVEPGPAGPTGRGHRATVTYDLLGMPYPTVVELYYDMGGHWGGVADRGWPELPLWWGVPVVVLLGLGGMLFTRGRRTPLPPATA
jgi:hypothetical protein